MRAVSQRLLEAGPASNSVSRASPRVPRQSSASARTPGPRPYAPEYRDEALTPDGEPRPAYREFFAALREVDLARLDADVQRRLAERDVTFGGRRGQTFHVDPVPRMIAAGEWERLATGLRQRARALNAFLADLYGERRIVAADVVPARVIDLAVHHEPRLDGVGVPGGHTPLIGFDLVRGRDGVLRVLEDNLRTPSGLGYALAARDALDTALLAAGLEATETQASRLDIESAPGMLRSVLDSARPPAGPESAVLLSDSVDAGARYEHDELGRRLGIAVVEPRSLRRRGEVLIASIGGEETEVGVVLRRSDEERFVDPTGASNWVAELFEQPLRAGRLTIVNAFGTGVADDKLTHAYVEAMVGFYLGEEPLVESVRTIDLSSDDERAVAFERFDELVIKPRSGHGGHGVFIGPHARPEDRERIRREVTREPLAFVAQETVELSTHPTVHAGALEPRHVDLRAFAIGERIVPGGLTRFARDRGALVVNSSQNGGAKDTWVVADAPDRA